MNGKNVIYTQICINLEEEKKGRWIGRDGPTPWPPRSPDLTPLDFFLWGYVKTQVFETEVQNIEQQKERISNAVASVIPAMLTNTWSEIRKRLLKLRDNQGRHVEH